MFNNDELTFLMAAVNAMPVSDTQTARNKGYMMLKLSDLLDQPPAPPAPPEEPEKKSPKKK